MTEADDIFEIAKKQFFADKFNRAFDEWKEKNKAKLPEGATQKTFARMIEVSENTIKTYKEGVNPREATLKRIISVLGVSDDYFTYKTEDERYKYSPGYMTELAENKILPYCEELGLDPEFLKSIRRIIGESFGDQFPVWTPIDRVREVFPENAQFYKHMDPMTFWSNSAQMTPDVEMFQIEVKRGGDDTEEKKLLTLSFPDLRFLKDVQDEVKDYVEYLFYKRREELVKEGQEASRRSLVLLKDGGKGFRGVSPDDLNEIDKYFHNYVERKPKSKTSDTDEEEEKDGDDQTS